jgi:hypothetical protein
MLLMIQQTRRLIISTKSDANRKAIELTQAELDSVMGGAANTNIRAARWRALRQAMRFRLRALRRVEG